VRNNTYHIILQKIDAFIRKYYKNQLIKGALLSITAIGSYFILAAVLEYYGNFSSTVRGGLFFGFVGITLFFLSKYIALPLMKLNKLGDVISHQEAAKVIGNHFSNVKDKLINILQLNEQVNQQPQTELLLASIEQKTTELNPIPFSAAIDIRENIKYLKYAAIPLFLFLIIALYKINILTDSSERLINYNTYFEKPAPFKFELNSANLQAIKNEDFSVSTTLSGNEIPQQVYVEIGGQLFKLDKLDKFSHEFTFNNIQENTTFRFFADGFYSAPYEISVLPNPSLQGFDVELVYPKYLKRSNQQLSNAGDMQIPQGTVVKWNFQTQDVEQLSLAIADTSLEAERVSETNFQYKKQFYKSSPYAISGKNKFIASKDTLRYFIDVVPDLYPSIELEQRTDSVSSKRVYFKGYIKDDYGLTQLTFNYSFLNKEEDKTLHSEKIGFNINSNQDQFFHFWNLAPLNIESGDEIEYYFEVWDNDGINGRKSSRSSKMVFKAPTLNELSEQTKKNNEEIKNDLQQSINSAKNIKKGLEDLNKKMLEKKNLGWEEKKKFDELLEQQKELQKELEQINQQNQQNNQKNEEYRQIDERILEKQEQLQKIFDELMNEDLKKMFEEMEKLMERMDKNQLQQQLEQMELKNEDLEKELDRTLELFKQLEVEQKVDELKNKLDDLAEKQEKLSEQTKNKELSKEELEKKQEELNKEFDKIQEDFKELEEKNQELERPNEMPNTSDEQKKIDENMEQGKEEISKGKNSKASEMQKQASDDMKSLSDKLSQMQGQMSSQQTGEDMENLRQILENLLRLSFDQEELMEKVKATNFTDPNYLALTQKQKQLKDASKVIQDSLFELSKRVVQLQSIVNKEINAINNNMDKAVEQMANRNTGVATSRQQLAMTSINNLALLLDEAVQQMQKQMAAQQNSGSCKNPGSNPGQKPGNSAAIGNMKKLQEQLNKQMQEMKDALEKGEKPGQKNDGGKTGGFGMSKEIAKMAATQGALRQKLQELQKQLESEGGMDGKKAGNKLNEISKMMEETETDLVNKNLTRQTMQRQEEILTRLLESEKAMREREFDDKRESREAKNEEYRNPSEFFEYNSIKNKEIELLKTLPPSFSTFYKEKVSGYFKTIQNTSGSN